MWSTVVIDWQGKQLSGEQMLVLQRVAEQFPEEDFKTAAYSFEHRLCEGLITCKGRATVGTFHGVIFHVYLGTVKDKPWTHEFLLVDGFREADMPHDIPINKVELLEDGRIQGTPIDGAKALGAKVSKLRRQ